MRMLSAQDQIRRPDAISLSERSPDSLHPFASPPYNIALSDEHAASRIAVRNLEYVHSCIQATVNSRVWPFPPAKTGERNRPLWRNVDFGRTEQQMRLFPHCPISCSLTGKPLAEDSYSRRWKWSPFVPAKDAIRSPVKSFAFLQPTARIPSFHKRKRSIMKHCALISGFRYNKISVMSWGGARKRV